MFLQSIRNTWRRLPKSQKLGMFFFILLSVLLPISIFSLSQPTNTRSKAATSSVLPTFSSEKIQQEKEAIRQLLAATKEATLLDVKDGPNYGKARVIRKDGKLIVTVFATIEPPTSSYYNVWLANSKSVSSLIRLGEMEDKGDNSYFLSYSSDNLYDDYNLVIVSAEKVNDSTIEEKILEGGAH